MSKINFSSDVMKQNLRESIKRWEKSLTNLNELRSAKFERREAPDNEYTITLRMAAIVTYLSESEKFELISQLSTMQQSVIDSELENPNSDVYLFDRVAKKLEKDFLIKFDEVYSKLWKSQTPNGFV